MKKLEYASLDDQIKKLKEQGLSIKSVESAKNTLKLLLEPIRNNQLELS